MTPCLSPQDASGLDVFEVDITRPGLLIPRPRYIRGLGDLGWACPVDANGICPRVLGTIALGLHEEDDLAVSGLGLETAFNIVDRAAMRAERTPRWLLWGEVRAMNQLPIMERQLMICPSVRENGIVRNLWLVAFD